LINFFEFYVITNNILSNAFLHIVFGFFDVIKLINRFVLPLPPFPHIIIKKLLFGNGSLIYSPNILSTLNPIGFKL
jgi:hypothetical protein